MTMTRSTTATAFQHFNTCVDNAPTGVFEDAKQIREMMGNFADDLLRKADALDLKVCNCDGIYNLEVEIYGFLRAKNEDRFLSAEGYGKTYDEADANLRKRINAGLISDRDFLEKMRIEREVEREALPYSFARPGEPA